MSEVLDILECPLCLHKLGNTLRSCDNRVICASCKHTWSLLPKDEVQVLRARLSEANAELDLVRYTNPNQIGYVLLWISGTISEIHKVATKAREKHSVKNHHCELRAAIDSICDRSKQDMAGLLECGKLYRTHELRTIEELREKLAEATARAERAEGEIKLLRVAFAEASHNDCQAGIEIDALKKRLSAIAPQGRTDGERLGWMEKVKPAIEYIAEHDYESQTKEWFWKLTDENGCWMSDEETLRAAIDAAMDATSNAKEGGEG